MSYKALKRILGEPSLERKCLFLFAGFLFALLTLSFAFYGSRTIEIVHEQNAIQGQLLVVQQLYSSHWEKFDELSKSQKVKLDTLPLVESPSDSELLTLPNSQQQNIPPVEENPMIEMIDTLINNFSSDNSVCTFIRKNGAGATDSLDHEMLSKYKNIPLAVSSEAPGSGDSSAEHDLLTVEGSTDYVYYQPIFAKYTCVICHNPDSGNSTLGGDDLAEGDLMAVAKVVIKDEKMSRKLDKNWAILWGTAIFSFFAMLLASYLIIRYVIIKPLRHLQEVSNEVSLGNITIRADIHTGDEFESLAKTFNRMLGNIILAQNNLRKTNIRLDLNIDQLANANMQLAELNRVKSEFLATMSHELRTPLNSILGFSEVLSLAKELNEKQQKYVRNIQNSGKMLFELINQVLDVAKMDAGSIDLTPVEFSISEFIAEQVDMVRPLATRREIQIEHDVPEGLDYVFLDRVRMQQIVSNLLSNAVKFSREESRVLLTVRCRTEKSLLHKRDNRSSEGNAPHTTSSEKNKWLTISVEDHGVGISKEDQQIVFEKFRQGATIATEGDTMAREYNGTGLGLSIVRELCRLHGGDVTVASELGEGSTFTVTLPWRLK